MKIDTETGTADTPTDSEQRTESVERDSQTSPDSGATSTETATAPAAVAEGPAELPLDQVFDILKNKRRRTVLRYLNSIDGSVKLGALAEYVAAIENDIDEVAVSSDQRKRVYVGLYQCHLPKMDDMSIIDFNQDRGIVELGANADQLDEYLALADEQAREWHKYYGGVALVGLGIMAVTLPVGGITPLIGFAAVNFLLVSTCLFHIAKQ